MTPHGAKGPLAGVPLLLRWALAAPVVVMLLPAPAAAQAGTAIAPGTAGTITGNDDHGSIKVGNGLHNKTSAQVYSPTVQSGTQQVSNSSVTGNAPSQSSLCRKRHRVCTISQKLWVSR